jgi:hypothetical protein
MANIHGLAAITSLAAADEFVVYQNTSGNDKRIATSNFIANGTWNPDLQFGGGNTGRTYNNVTGLYVRVGRLIVVNCVFQLAAKGSSTGNAIVQDSGGVLAALGTPTTVATGIVNFDTMTSSLVGMQVMQIGTAFYLQGLTAAATTMSTLTHAAFANTTTIRFTVSYFI